MATAHELINQTVQDYGGGSKTLDALWLPR
jgi:hypothetical protein